MSLFAVAALGATGLGPAIAGWIEQSLGWRWIQWLQIIIFGAFFPFFTYVMSETRGMAPPLNRAQVELFLTQQQAQFS